MSTNVVNTTIEILSKFYPIRCPESELKSLQQAAEFLNKKMAEIKETGKTITLERIAIIAALNIAYQFLQLDQLDQQKNNLINNVNQRLTLLQDQLDMTINKACQNELLAAIE